MLTVAGLVLDPMGDAGRLAAGIGGGSAVPAGPGRAGNASLTGRFFLDVALSAVCTEEREGYTARLEVFLEHHRARLEELLRAYGPGSRPAPRTAGTY